jgi:nucleotide-binding universal stress UspA family protein
MNPIQTILVHVDADPHCATRLRLARAWAGRLGASVAAIYAVTPAAMGLSLVFTAGVPDEKLLAYDEKRLADARKRVQEACLEPGVQIEWHEVIDVPERDFMRQALYADLLVLGQHEGAHRDAGTSAHFVHSVIIESGKPALVVPSAAQGEPDFGTVFVAWKETREAARALTASVPFLQRAKTVIVGVDAETIDAHRTLLRRFLLRHGVDAQFRSVSSSGPPVGDTLIAMAADVGASLMVMGCYGHSRGRERVLGGATRGVLRSMTVPLFMAH